MTAVLPATRIWTCVALSAVSPPAFPIIPLWPGWYRREERTFSFTLLGLIAGALQIKVAKDRLTREKTRRTVCMELTKHLT